MSNDKIYKKLPVVLQTTAIKNFFESTVEQLFSKSNVETINGFIGHKTSADDGVVGYLTEPTNDRERYALSPVVNTINFNTAASENLIFFDEFVDTLSTYGVDVKNQNKLFSSNYTSFMPPIDIDKFINYQEYYWYPQGPSSIAVEGTLSNPIDIDRDIIGKSSFTAPNGVTFRNGMIIRFRGIYVIPQSQIEKEFIVEGVGNQIYLVEKQLSSATRFSTVVNYPYDGTGTSNIELPELHSAANISSVVIVNQGIGYVDPTIVFVGVNTAPAAGTVTTAANGAIVAVSIDDGGDSYSGTVGIQLSDVTVQHNIDYANMAAAANANVFITDEIIMLSVANVKVGQQFDGVFSGIVSDVDGSTNTVTLSQNITFVLSDVQTQPQVNFSGRDFLAEVRLDDMHVIDVDSVEILSTQARVGVNPNTGEYYLLGGAYAFDAVNNPLTDEDDLRWDAGLGQSVADYLLQARGASNRNVWSRVNYWYHKQNFLDAGDELPSREFRANRPILEFDRTLELHNHGVRSVGSVDIASTLLTKNEVNGAAAGLLIDDVPVELATIIFPNEIPSVAQFVYIAVIDTDSGSETFGKLILQRVGDPTANPIGAVDGDIDFVPLQLINGDVLLVNNGKFNIGKEYVFGDNGFTLAQEKISANQAPLFNLYDSAGNYLGDEGVYPDNNFLGNKIFGYAVNTDSNINDSVLGFPLIFQPFKASSEILFEIFSESYVHRYVPFGSSNESINLGYKFHKLIGNGITYQTVMKPSQTDSVQKISTTYTLDRFDIDKQTVDFYIGCIPNANVNKGSGYDIDVLVNGIQRTDFQYGVIGEGLIRFDDFNFSMGDFVEISAVSSTGLLREDTISGYDLPMGWRNNPRKTSITVLAEPEFLPHFKNYIQNQDGFVGDALGINNFTNTAKDSKHAKDIVINDYDLILGAFLLDDQQHNLLDAVRFNSAEYQKYKSRVKKEINTYFAQVDITTMTNEAVLEQVLRRVISYNIGREVFNRTYIVPYGDNYVQQQFVINDTNTDEFVLSAYADLDKIENALLVYKNDTLLCIDECYEIVNYNPITIKLLNATVQLGDVITSKLYNEERDSAQCPPTPSTMGLYPLFYPQIIEDNTFQSALNVLIGHDGSRTVLWGDRRDQILLDFERRIYNSAKVEFRSANSLPPLNIYAVKPGVFRNTGFSNTEWADLLRYNFAQWISNNDLDFVTNEFYDADNEWTWNYRGNNDSPGHWRGWYEYYYDTVRPHTHPWEMLAFFEKPLWWDEQYGTDYGSSNSEMWSDIEQGLIRQGRRANITNDAYLRDNPYRREGLHLVLPVDADANLRTPKEIFSTGTTTKINSWTNTVTGNNTVEEYHTNSFLTVDGLNISFDSNNVYVQGENLINHTVDVQTNAVGFGPIESQPVSYNIPIVDLTADAGTFTSSTMPNYAVAVLINGIALYTPKSTKSWNDEGGWHYNNGTIQNYNELSTYAHSTVGGLFHYHSVVPEAAGLTDWDDSVHSGIVGWAFDGLPIYGPYGYTEYAANGSVIDSTITNIKSPFKLRSGTRTTGPGGAYTGMFVEDYDLDILLADSAGYTDKFNKRYGVTPDSPTTPIHFYVATIDDELKPMFPYAVGGDIGTHTDSNTAWANKYFGSAPSASTNTVSSAVVNSDATASISSVLNTSYSVDLDAAASAWKFGDNAPVENAWRYTEGYPFAVVEALLLARPGEFSTKFADPTKLYRAGVNANYLLSTETNRPWQYWLPDDFEIHGETDADGNFVTNIGYSQFVHTWLKFQNLDTTVFFVDKVRTLNTKLGHRMAGFIDKDTMTLRTDQYSGSGNATSLIIPSENVNVQVHSSPYKTRNSYSGVIIEKTAIGYKVRGYDRSLGYFNTLVSDTNGPRERVTVGGKPASFVDFTLLGNYKLGTIVRYQNAYYITDVDQRNVQTFDRTLWKRLGSLPQIGGATATFYQRSLDTVARVDYETEFTDIDSLYDFLIGLGRYQEAQGYDFGTYDTEIADVRNWAYAAKQMLFWVTGRWEIGNTLELSPAAPKLIFDAPRGFIAKINRSERNQFTLVDQNGSSIPSTQCEIVREDNRIEVVPPEGVQIYGAVLFTKEIEHAITVDNITQFNDLIFNPQLNQAHSRMKIKATRTADWDGRLLTEGFIIDGDELRPNLDNMAESLGRFHELGFVPVDKQMYDEARSTFGFTQKEYLRELDILDDDQFEFYKGMIQNKGTSNSLSQIARSSAVVQGEITVFDEWALRVADFGDTENDQSIELKIEKSEIVSDPQLITLAFPEDVTGIVNSIEILERKHKYFSTPQIVISAPEDSTGTKATAVATLRSNGELDSITVTNGGSGYGEHVGIKVIAGNIVVAAKEVKFNPVFALSEGDWIDVSSLTNLVVTNHLTDVTSNISLSSVVTEQDLANTINAANIGITASVIRSDTLESNIAVDRYTLQLVGSDFTIDSADAGLNLITGFRYQPRQRYAISAANNTVTANITVSVDDVAVSSSNWDFDQGDRWQITTAAVVDAGSAYSITLNSGIDNGSTQFAFENTQAVDNNRNYLFVDVYVNGAQILNQPDLQVFTLSNNSVNFANISLLPKSVLTPLPDPATGQTRFVLNNRSNVFIVEKPTIDFTDSYEGDLPGSTLNITVETNDAIAIKLGTKRIYEITPDAKDDEVILIDIDDSERFLKKPLGVREFNLWPTTDQVNHTGITDSKFVKMPNAGYVNSANINFMAYDISSLPDLFAEDVIIKPQGGSLIHMAASENNDWNVFELVPPTSTVSFVTRNSQNNAVLYTNSSLFEFIDSNLIGELDTSRYLDFYLTLKNADVSDNVVMWTNETVVQQKQSQISDFRAPRMIEARIKSIGPAEGSLLQMSNVTPIATRTYKGAAITDSDENDIVTVSGIAIPGLTENDAVQLKAGITTSYTFNANITFNSVGNVTISSANVDFVIAPGHVTLLTDGDATANNDQYFVSNVTVGSFTINDDYFTDANVVAGLGNVRYVVETFEEYGNSDVYYIASNVTASSFTIERANTVASTVNVVHMNQSKIEVSQAHGLEPGDVVRVFSNAFAGAYTVRSTPSNTTLIVDAPFTYDATPTGTVLKPGVQIVTTDAHGIHPLYAENRKRVALHFVTPKTYNKVFTVDSVTPDSIILTDQFAYDDRTRVYFDVASGYANAASNTVTVSSQPLLSSTTVLYTGNAQIVPSYQYIVNPTNVVFNANVLPSDANVSINFTIVREKINIGDNRYPVLTTVDHNSIKLNNSEIVINSFNNPEGAVAAINRSQNIKRSQVVNEGPNKFSVGFNVLRDYRNSNLNTPNYGPYARTVEDLGETGRMMPTSSMVMNDPIEFVVDKKFNKGPIYVGPIKGFTYNKDGVLYIWDFGLKKYLPQFETVTFQATGRLSGVSDVNDGAPIADDTSDSDTADESLLPVDTDQQDAETGNIVLPPLHASGNILTLIPGSAQFNPSPLSTMGRKWAQYDMTELVTLGTTTLNRWRLKANSDFVYEVYEAVENSAGTVYYILVDRVYPPLVQHDVAATISAHNDFGGKIQENFYYLTGIQFDGTAQDKASANPTGSGYIDIPPVEPAFYVGKQLIPEPFAVSGGNGTDKTLNFAMLPGDIFIGTDTIGGETRIRVNSAGMNSFLMWQPGLTPGQWEPTQEGPGALPGRFDVPVFWGFGRGYYSANDTHEPDSVLSLTGRGYPGFNLNGWNKRQPRFKYNKDFTVFPTQTPDTGYTLFDDNTQDPTNQTIYSIRPEEIFIACFWTESFTYRNQLIGYNYNNLDAAGNPAPIYDDYEGTIARVKYIRLTELPADVVLRRPIVDTGWAGKGWKNSVIDNVVLPGEFGTAANELDTWSVFDPEFVAGGSTGDEEETVNPVDVINPISATAVRRALPGVGEGIGRSTPVEVVTLADPEDNSTVPSPVLNANYMSTLPSRCVVVPVIEIDNSKGTCFSRPGMRDSRLLTQISDQTHDESGEGLLEVHELKVVGKNPFMLFFDFSQAGVLANGITIEQAANKEDFDVGLSRLIVDTRSDPNGAPEVSGSQIGSYGIDNIPLYNKLFLSEVNDAFGVSINDVLNNQRTLTAANGDSLAPIATSPKGYDVGVKGFGWLQRTIDCARGEWIRITVSKGKGNTSGLYNLYVIYFSEDVSQSNFNSSISTCENSPSSAYIDGAVERTWRAATKKGSFINSISFGFFGAGKQRKWGYFGTTGKSTSGTWDNIYYPYHSITKAPGHQIVGNDMEDSHANTAEGGGGVYVATATRKTITSFAPSVAGKISTAEFKGYFYAPVNGTYVFRTISNDGSYVWVSDVDDTSDEEKYTNDGYNADLGDRNYTWSNATVSNGGMHSAKITPPTGTVFLRGGKYYFVRGIYGNARDEFEFKFEVQMPNSTAFIPVEFSGKYCEPEVIGTSGCSATNTATGENGTFTGFGEYFAYNDYFMNYQDGLGINYDNTIYNVGNLNLGDLPADQAVDVTVLCPSDTPIINPAPVGVNSDEIFSDQNNQVTANTFTDQLTGFEFTAADTWAITDARDLQGNFTGYSQDPMTGFNFMPSNFKVPTARQVVAPQRLGYSIDLAPGRFVNATSQRVTGGAVIPLANPITAVSRTPTPLRSFNIENEPWYKRNTLGSLNKTFRNVTYDPKRIGSTVNFNGRTVNNIVTDFDPASTANNVIVNNVAGENTIPGVGVTASAAQLSAANMPIMGPAVEAPLENQKFDNVGIEFTRVPTINITPLVYDQSIGSYAPAGTPAVASIYKATPSTRVSANLLSSVPAGSELFINNKKITFRQGTTAREIANQFKCGETGVDVRVVTTDAGTQELDITSCSDNPITIRNGCGGGSLKRVGDFHVVRGFEQVENSMETITDTANATVLPAATGFSNVFPTVEYTRYSVDGEDLGVMPEVSTTGSGTVHDIRSVTTSVSRSKSLAGTGYRVGDRLRLVGGTPVNNTKGPITVLCITNPGAGYNNPANIRIQIGDGNTPGYGGAAEVISLDPVTGGIAAVRLLNPGVGYDVEFTPTITVTDRSNRSWTTVDINEDSGVYGRNTILEMQGITEVDVNGTMLSTTRWFRVSGNSVTIGETFTYDTSNVSLVDVVDLPVTPQLKVEAANIADVEYVTVNGTVTLLTSGDPVANNRSYLVTQVNRTTGEFWIADTYFADSNVVSALGTVEFSVKKPLAVLLNEGNLTPITDQRLGITSAEITALVASQPREGGGLEFTEGFRSFAGPLRVAKFVVTSVDGDGGITSLRVLDRGLYKVFPADLTYGIPLEYDFEYVGNNNPPNNALGIADPSRDNLQYGPGHPEYDAGVFVNGRHPDFHIYPEFKFDPISNSYVTYNGTPGGYDPLTYVDVNGLRLNKVYKIDLDPLSATYGEYVQPLQVGGGTGARVFLTAEEVPDCSEAGRAKETLGLPDEISQIDVPQALADALNGALVGAGYRPQDIRAEVVPVGPSVGQVKLVSNYPGFNIGTNTPGFPEKFGIETGDYNNGMLCIKATLSTPNLTLSQVEQQVNQLYDNTAFGLLSNESVQQFLPPATTESARLITPPTVLSLFCVDNIVSDPNSPMFSDDVIVINELYRYDIQNIFGSPVTLRGAPKQQTNVYAFESRRYETFEQYQGTLEVLEEPNGNVWVDQYQNHDTANISMPGFISGGWAYLENDVPQRWQTSLVDTAFINNSIVYDSDSGDKEFDLEFWDPFKGVIPGFVRNELHFINDVDPVNYNNSRTNFGSNNVGKVWWDTSTLRYMWYEQGSNRERWKNWGRTFPGSSITVCEWVESRALPQNWNGNGTPRWADRYITERRQDPVTGQYVNYYYYWVQNRSRLDDRVKQQLGRKFDALTLARYIANPIGYGLNLISFVSDQSFVLSNIAERLREDENIIQINLSRNLNPDGLKHTAWKLMREGDNNSIVPDHLSDKLIDSLCGENAIGQVVPDPILSVVERYGIQFRPRQTMFRNVKDARRVMASVLNSMLADIQLQTNYANWRDDLPTQLTYLETVSWYAVERIDNATNREIRYDSSYKPVFNVTSVSALQTLNNLPDGSVIQVKANAQERAQLWIYTAGTDSFKQIAISNETVRIKDSVFADDTNAILSNELRLLLNTLKNTVFANTDNWNRLFFALLKHAYMEQKQLSWAFKTSYVYVEKEEQDLVKITGFKPDNFNKVIEYMNEVKPFTAKIREYKDGKTAPIETIGATMISDFDKPPYADRVNGVIRVLDDFNGDDATIMANDPTYQNYYSITNKSSDPFRKGHIKMTFDRTNWKLTQFGYDAANVSFDLSVARNMANINAMTAQAVSANVNLRAVDRIFKFDPTVRLSFAAEVSAHYNDVSAGSNTSIITNATMLYDIISSGNLSLTQELVKQKVGGGWRGETVDANVFARVVEGLDSTVDYLTHFGWDTDPWDTVAFDRTVEVINYEGIFNDLTQGPITLRRNEETYEGFDGITFKRMLYGEERPEELVMLAPLESLIIDVYTSPYANGDANTAPVAADAVAVKYRMHQNLFGETQFLRIFNSSLTALSNDVYAYSTEITVDDATVLPAPIMGAPGVIWIGTERVLYGRIDGNVLSELTRGTAGTTVQDHATGTAVWDGSQSQTMQNLNTDQAVWLDTVGANTALSLSDVSNVDVSNVNSIMKFIHNL